jgi:hypothetical protein
MEQNITLILKLTQDLQRSSRSPVLFRLYNLDFDFPLPCLVVPVAACDLVVDIDVFCEIASVDYFVEVVYDVFRGC